MTPRSSAERDAGVRRADAAEGRAAHAAEGFPAHAAEGLGPAAREPEASRLEPWEVFRQEKEGDPMRHGGNVMAPDAVLALDYAREMFGRRQESVRLWVVRRADIRVLDDRDLLQPPLDRSFKKPGGYVMRDKLAAARSRAEAEAVTGRGPTSGVVASTGDEGSS